MDIIREYREIDSDEIVIKIPPSFGKRKVEILVLPADNAGDTNEGDKSTPLTTYKCNGKRADFSRADAYSDEF